MFVGGRGAAKQTWLPEWTTLRSRQNPALRTKAPEIVVTPEKTAQRNVTLIFQSLYICTSYFPLADDSATATQKLTRLIGRELCWWTINLTECCLRRGTGGDRDPRKWGKGRLYWWTFCFVLHALSYFRCDSVPVQLVSGYFDIFVWSYRPQWLRKESGPICYPSNGRFLRFPTVW